MAEGNLLSTDHMAAILEHTPGGIAVYQYDGGRISPLFHNPAFYKITGYSPENIRNIQVETSLLGVHPDDIEFLCEQMEILVDQDRDLECTYRLWNDTRGEYRWICLKCSSKTLTDKTKLLYCIYDDVTLQKQMEKELGAANEKMQDIVNAIPGGVAIYKVSDIFETIYFSEGVPELSGYTVEEYYELIKRDAAEMTYREDMEMVVSNAKAVVESRGVKAFEFRKQHKDGHIVWVNVHMKWIGEEDGCALLHCVFHNVSELKDAQIEMDYLVNSIPGGIASYKREGNRFYPVFFSDGAMGLTGHTRDELQELAGQSVYDMIYELDQQRVMNALESAYESGEVLNISYRMRHKNGGLVWIHLNGRRIGPLNEFARFYAIFTGMSPEARLFQSMADETADELYVIDKNNYDLLYTNAAGSSRIENAGLIGEKCYKALYEKDEPCSFCTLKSHSADGEEHEMKVEGVERFYTTRFKELVWNGLPAYVKYVRDVTEEVKYRKEKERLEGYFGTVVKQLPGGISVILCQPDGTMTPEYISDGLAQMFHMTVDEVRELYAAGLFAGVCSEDIEKSQEKLKSFLETGEGHCELTGCMRRGDGGDIWVKLLLSLREGRDGVRRLYSVYTDITGTIEEKERLLRQYEEQLRQHHHRPGPDVLVTGHCNVTRNQILEIVDYTNCALLQNFGKLRDSFFKGVASFIIDEADRQAFLDKYLNEPMQAAYDRKDREQTFQCFVRLPGHAKGKYVRFKVNLVEAPDTGDITGILTVTDITEKIIADSILHQLSIQGHDEVMDLDLEEDTYCIITKCEEAGCKQKNAGCLSELVRGMLQNVVVPRDREQYARGMDASEMRKRLEKEDFYTFAYSLADQNGDVRTKNMTVSLTDRRLWRVCLVCTDITDSVREQQGLLNMIAYTFELAGFLNVNTDRFTMYTRQAVLENLPPHVMESYSRSIEGFTNSYILYESRETAHQQFQLETILHRLEEEPGGYDFVVSYKSEEGLRYKQVNVLWGDQNHRTVCLVRADVTDMLSAERQTKKALEEALKLAEEASLAKSDFLSAMSHDIRTPMNAIMGMTALAEAHLDERERVASYLKKISVASRHLLSLINDVLDMSRIERSRLSLNSMKIILPELITQVSDIIELQARDAGIVFEAKSGNISHPCFYGDSLRITQVLINLLSNGVKFTSEGGRVDLFTEELSPVIHGEGWVRFRFTIRDTGRGIPEESMEEIFSPFVRSSTAEDIEGTGLGLSITKGLIDLMGGQIYVESQVNKGSSFYVELEFKIEENYGAEQAFSEKEEDAYDKMESFAGCCFLVAEDNDINAEILCEILAMNGAKAVVKKNGAQAVEAFQEAEPGTYDAILMDIQMPVMNGYEASRRIRKTERADAAVIPIVAMTANAFAEDIQASADAGMTAHVSKPVDMDVLWDTLRKVLGSVPS